MTAACSEEEGETKAYVVKKRESVVLQNSDAELTVEELKESQVTFAAREEGAKPWSAEVGTRYHVGNHEYVTVKQVDLAAGKATIEVFTRKLDSSDSFTF